MDRGVQIRAGREEDQEWCARLMAESEPWITLRQDLELCRQKVARAGTELFVAEGGAGRELAGFILLVPYGFAGSPYINSIAVASEARGRGVGADLLRFAEKHFAGSQHLFLLVSSFNARAQAFYRRERYEYVGELKDYIVSRHSELIFFKRLE
jgi:[ribosomal protein S18]-alanine N-acetyltransferase